MTDPDVGHKTFAAVLGHEPSRAELGKLMERRLHHLYQTAADSEDYRVLDGVEELLPCRGRHSVLGADRAVRATPASSGGVAGGRGGRVDHRGPRAVRPADPALPGDQAPQLEAAGGLLLVALDLLRGEVQGLSGEGKVNVAFVPLGTPLLAGPGAIAVITVFMREASTADERVGVALGLVGLLVVLWLTLRFAGVVGRLLGQSGIELVTHISGLLLTAIAVQLVADAIREFIREASDVPPASDAAYRVP
jgi:hypothetical protein